MRTVFRCLQMSRMKIKTGFVSDSYVSWKLSGDDTFIKTCTAVASICVNRCISTAKKFEFKLSDVQQKWKRIFEEENVSEPSESIENILAHFLGSRKLIDVQKMRNKILTEEDIGKIEQMCHLRLKRLPVQYIIGEWDFRDLTLKMSSPVFIPRPETEKLVDLALDAINARKCPHLLELCAGSGAISVALLKALPKIKVTAVEQSNEACQLTKENARRYKLSERLCIMQKKITPDNRFDFIKEKFDVIVSNPPYVPTRDIKNIQQEIALYEDLAALDGGEDGLQIIKLILDASSKLLNPSGALLLEVDPSHPDLLKDWLRRNSHLNLRYHKTHQDFCKKDRFVEIIKEPISTQ